MRGAQHPGRHRRDARGIIPAAAGSTCSWVPSPTPHRDLPRGCGEHRRPDSGRMKDMGSSTRMRGAHEPEDHRPDEPGIIPANAGSTATHPRSSRRTWDHPRGCGEHRESPRPRRCFSGSSPRMRGARPPCLRCGTADGIIPADAGSTRGRRSTRSLPGDHPRGCGEHTGTGRRSTRSLPGDHPRGCGEHSPVLINGPTVSGSSPRMRGARRSPCRAVSREGIIPADAGSTRTPTRRSLSSRDHPRGCGGARHREDRARGEAGIIPADAGSTHHVRRRS